MCVLLIFGYIAILCCTGQHWPIQIPRSRRPADSLEATSTFIIFNEIYEPCEVISFPNCFPKLDYKTMLNMPSCTRTQYNMRFRGGPVRRRARRKAAVLLSTHSMEEAEALCQRIAIFAHGRVQCIGEPQVRHRWTLKPPTAMSP